MKTTKYEIKNTLGMFDFLKGSIMLIVMLSHTAGLFDFMQDYSSFGQVVKDYGVVLVVFYLAIYILGEASMPIMFILSGYGFRKTSFKKCLKKQCKTLLIPYVISMLLVTVVHFVAFSLYYGNIRENLVDTAKIFKYMLLGYASSTPNWFLLALIIGNLVFNMLLNYLDGKKLAIAALLVACAGWGLSLGKPVPFSFSQGLIATLYICAGYYAKKKKLFVSEYSAVKRTLIIVGTILFSLSLKGIGDDMNMAFCTYTLGPFTIIGNLFVSIGLIYIFLLLNRFRGVLLSQISRIGRYSLYVLCIHSIELKSVGEYIQWIFIERWTGTYAIRTLIQFGTRVVVVIGITYLFIRIKRLIICKMNNSSEVLLLRREQA